MKHIYFDTLYIAGQNTLQIVETSQNLPVLISGFVRVLENLESPEILLWHFPGLESPGKRPLVLESSGKLLNPTKKHKIWKAVRKINMEILRV